MKEEEEEEGEGEGEEEEEEFKKICRVHIIISMQ